MNQQLTYKLLADLVLLIHFLIVVFIVVGLLLIVIGGIKNWRWIRNSKFRYLHLTAIAFVVIQSWLGQLCPLTILENTLRLKAGETDYTGSFIAYWLGEILFYDLPLWMFALLYSVFGLLVIFCWFKFKPDSLKVFR